MDLSNKRVKKDGRLGNIFNYVTVGVHWDNGGMTKEDLESLEFIDENIKAGHGLKPTTTRPEPKPRP